MKKQRLDKRGNRKWVRRRDAVVERRKEMRDKKDDEGKRKYGLNN